jgi:Undecaprenyl-phosphate galactose phosphotransferase WbaP
LSCWQKYNCELFETDIIKNTRYDTINKLRISMVRLMEESKVSLHKQEAHVGLTTKYSYYLLPLILMVVDYAAIYCAEELAFVLRNWLMPQGPELYISWLSFNIICPFTYIVFFQLGELYTRRIQFWRQIARIFKINIYATVAIVVMMYVGQIAGSTSRLFTFLLWLFTFIFVISFRFVAKRVLDRYKLFRKPVLIMGAGKTAAILLEHLEQDTGLNYHFVGYLEDNIPELAIASRYKYLGGFEEAEAAIRNTGVKSVIITAPGMSQEKIQELVYRLQPLVQEISFIPDMGSLPLASFDAESLIDGHIVMFNVRNNLASWYNKVLKFTFDFVLTACGTIAISPLLLGIALWIKRDSPGPVIFKHRRVGKDGKIFECYKFRTMCLDAEKKLSELLKSSPSARAEWEKDFKLKNDPRITKSGKFLRETSLDELPQIFNVLKGEMSLVGPRPIIQAEIPRYGKYIEDFYMVRPGITGMWQTSGRSDVTYDERVQMDTWYVRNWNVWFDVVLLWRTFKVVISKKGAY